MTDSGRLTAKPYVWREGQDLGLLMLVAGVIYGVWTLALGWTPHTVFAVNDAAASFLPFLPDLIAAGGRWQEVLYRAEVLGGIQVSPYYGMLPMTGLLAHWGWSPAACINGTYLAVQGLVAFLGTKAVLSLGLLWSRPDQTAVKTRAQSINAVVATVLSAAAIAVVFAFMPAVFWRLVMGHAMLLAGLLVFLGSAALVTAASAGRLTWTLGLVAFGAFLHAVQGHGQQTVVLSAVSGGPILLGLCLARDGASSKAKMSTILRLLLLPLLLGVAALLTATPLFAVMLAAARSGDSVRGVGGTPAIYSMLLGDWSDWLQSVPWSAQIFTTARSTYDLHETNYGFGPVLLLPLLLVPWQRRRLLGGLGLGMSCSLLLALILGLKLEPWASWLLQLMPPLSWFRIPQRTILPWALSLVILAGAGALAGAARAPRWQATLGGVLLLVPALVLQGPWREAYAWFAVGISAIGLRLLPESWRSAGPLLLLLAAGSIFAARERLAGYWSADEVVLRARALQTDFNRAVPATSSPLNRVAMGFQLPMVGYNSPVLAGLSALDGYWTVASRFHRLVGAAAHHPLDPFAAAIQFSPKRPGFELLSRLYNICWEVRIDQGQLIADPLTTCSRAAWLSSEVEMVGDEAALVARLEAHGSDTAAYRRHLVIVSGDQAAPPQDLLAAPAALAPCAEAQLLNLTAPSHSQRFEVTMSGLTTPCPMTMAMNYSGILQGMVQGQEGQWQPLPLFPAYGALTGAWLPAGSQRAVIEAKVETPLWQRLAQITGVGLGVLSSAVAVFWPWRQRSRSTKLV